MDAMLDERLDLDGFWAAYVGNMTPLEFMNRQYSPDIRECVEEYVSLLPRLFGIVRRQTWKDAFGAPLQFRKDAVLAALVDKLEMTEEEWRPHLNQRPRPEPMPEPAPVAAEEYAAAEHPEADAWTPETGEHVEEVHAAAPAGEGIASADEIDAGTQDAGAPEEINSPEIGTPQETKDGEV